MSKLMRYDPYQVFRRSFFNFPSFDWIDDLEESMMLKLDMYEENNQVVVEADLPGISPENVELHVTTDSATIKAKSKEEVEEKNRDYIKRERRFGTYARTINFPVQVVPDKAEAEFHEGTLVLRIPKEEKLLPKAVEVKIKKDES